MGGSQIQRHYRDLQPDPGRQGAVENHCIDHDGKPDRAIGVAVPQDATNAKLKVSFLPQYLRWIPFTEGDYWVLAIDPEYSVALVGTPDRKHLWLLARRAAVQADVVEDYLAVARAQGFDLDRLITPRQWASCPPLLSMIEIAGSVHPDGRAFVPDARHAWWIVVSHECAICVSAPRRAPILLEAMHRGTIATCATRGHWPDDQPG